MLTAVRAGARADEAAVAAADPRLAHGQLGHAGVVGAALQGRRARRGERAGRQPRGRQRRQARRCRRGTAHRGEPGMRSKLKLLCRACACLRGPHRPSCASSDPLPGGESLSRRTTMLYALHRDSKRCISMQCLSAHPRAHTHAPGMHPEGESSPPRCLAAARRVSEMRGRCALARAAMAAGDSAGSTASSAEYARRERAGACAGAPCQGARAAAAPHASASASAHSRRAGAMAPAAAAERCGANGGRGRRQARTDGKLVGAN